MKLSDEEYLKFLYAQKEKDLTLIANWDECIYARQVAVALLPTYNEAIKRLEQRIAFKSASKHPLLMPALREFADSSKEGDLFMALTLEETERIFSKLVGVGND